MKEYHINRNGFKQNNVIRICGTVKQYDTGDGNRYSKRKRNGEKNKNQYYVVNRRGDIICIL